MNEAINLSEQVSMISVLILSVSDSSAVSDTPQFETSPFYNIVSSAVISGYKWLTQKLYDAQQKFTVRPYFSLKVVDDTIQPNAEFFSGAGTPLYRGGMVTAPDGTVLAAGFDGSNHIVFLKGTDLNASSGVWSSSLNISTAADLSPANNQVAISVSDWFNGTYQIDIYFFSNLVNDGTDVVINNAYSTDGGATFITQTYSASSMANNNGQVLSIAALQTRNVGGLMKSGCVYMKKNSHTFASGFTGYDIFYRYGDHSGGFYNDIQWSYNNADSFDWTMQGLTAFFLDGRQFVAFSGFHNILNSTSIAQNFSLWVTEIQNITGVTASDLWTQAIPIMPIGSTSSINQNSFNYPMATVEGGMVYIVAEAVLVDSVSQSAQGTSSAVVTTHTNYILLNSDDGRTFSYPSILLGSSGTEFDSGSTACFIKQGDYWYLGGSAGYLWEYVQNNITADLTEDVIGYSVNDQSTQPSSISVKVANADNKWVGQTTTGVGASAISRDKKIILSQGYYDSDGNPQVVPKSVFYIDDIYQQITGTRNDLTIVGRDLYKKMKTTITKFGYQFIGPVFYQDIFDGTTNNNWNAILGTWTFQPSTNTLEGYTTSGEATMMFTSVPLNTFGHSMRIFFKNFASNTVYVYGMYIDTDNWLRLEVNTSTNGWAVVKNVGGVPTTMDSGTIPTAMTAVNYYMILVRRYSYWDFNFIFSRGGGTGNELGVYNPSIQSYLFKNASSGHYSMQGAVASTTSLQTAFTVGIGTTANIHQTFKFFQLNVFNNSNNVGEAIRSFARIAGIFSFKIMNTFRELFYTTTQINGTFTATNRVLQIAAGNRAISSTNSMSNGEVSFNAKLTPTDPAVQSGFKFIFRSNSATVPTLAYYFHVIRNADAASTAATVCRFEALNSGVVFTFFNSAEDVNYNPQFTDTPALHIDPTVYHNYRIVMINGQMSAFVDNVMVAAWNDDNTSVDYLTSGYWGFQADSNSTVNVQEVTAPILWKPFPIVSFNPGDDIESSITALASSLMFSIFSDLLGRLKTVFLNSTDPSTYVYDNQLFNQGVDQSDKEYVSQATVYGNGVVATARNTTLMPGVITRDAVVVDYTILTKADAQTRANNVLIGANQYLNQNASKQVINVGSEIFDVVTVNNQGNNTSGVNEATRIYDQTISQGGGENNSDYFLEIDTGKV